MPFRPLQALPVLAALLVVFGTRIYLLPDGGMPGYDGAKNWQIAGEIASGDFTNMFFHRSPFFHLLNGFLIRFLPRPEQLVVVNALFGTLSTFVLCRLVARRLQLPAVLFSVLLMVAGLCVYMVHAARFVTIEAASLPAFAFFLVHYVKRSETNLLKHWYWAVFWLGLGLTINYKFVFLFPVVLALEYFQPSQVLRKKVIARSIALLAAPFLFFACLGLLFGLPWWRYPGTYIGFVRFTTPNAAMRVGKFNTDASFYFRYLFSFESPLALLGLALYPVLYKPWKYLRRQPLSLVDILALISYCFMAGMLFLLKAPRGLNFAYLPMYLLGFICLYKLLIDKKPVLYLLLLASVAVCGWRINEKIYRYSYSAYPGMAAKIEELRIEQVGQTVGNGLVPFAGQHNFTVEPFAWQADADTFMQKRPAWIVSDSYYLITNIGFFDSLQQVPAVAEMASPALLSPFLFLEHAEFTGLGYTQTMRLRQKAADRPHQLRLIKLP